MRGVAVLVACGLFASPAAAADELVWKSLGNGVAFADTGDTSGANAFIGYAGYKVKAEHARAWVTALHRASLRARGVRYLFAVQGPDDPLYRHAEIANSSLARTLASRVSSETRFVAVLGHSSGSYVAHELFTQIAPAIAKKVVYFDLDGGDNGLTARTVKRLRQVYFVGSVDGAKRTNSPHADKMRDMAKAFGGNYLQNDASDSGCNAGAVWCVHATLVIARPHDPTNVDPVRDYSDFVERPVAHAFIDQAEL